MKSIKFSLSRRRVVQGAGALAFTGLAPAIVRAQGQPITLGILTPLTGAGGADGPRMEKAMKAVFAEVNAAGGVLGRKIETVLEDDQTNPEAAVRAARKLIDVNKVPAILGTWASAVTTAVAPLCWESKTFLCTTSGADSITLLPHQGYLIRTQPNNYLQAARHAEFIASTGAKRVFVMSIQAPFSQPTQDRVKEVLPKHGSEMVGGLIYDKDKTTYRSEVDQALRTKPDMIYLNGYSPDVTVVARDLFRAGYSGGRFTQSYVMTQKVIDSLPGEVTEGMYIVQPSADVNSPAYDLVKKLIGVAAPDSYECAANDWASLVVLAMAKGGAATGQAMRDNVRKISQGGGAKVYSAVEGLQLLAQAKEINYEGASGPCDFNEIGDILDCKFRYSRITKAKIEFMKVF
ncbi:MAG: amino acid ABC transporter substrate-binding protein [Alphaproteobacteria bacterium]|nr:amino acid ABC transporter substrate-binding protein [Alphaproteobacteria bacterium]